MNLQAKLELFNAREPTESARALPGLWYRDPEIHVLEQNLFRASWQPAGSKTQLAGPGSFFTVTIAGEPVLILKDETDRIRAFANVCRHRGACVEHRSKGETKALTCRYHGWTYGLNGDLHSAPELGGVKDFNRDEYKLHEYAVDACGPLLFVFMGENPAPLWETLKSVFKYTNQGYFDSLRFAERKEYLLDCNWKVFVDNYLDGGYHVNTIHPALSGVLDYENYRTELGTQSNVQISPMRKATAADDVSAGQVRQGEAAYYWWFFPNYMLNLYDDLMDVNIVFPTGPEQCRVVFDFYFFERHSQDFQTQSIAVAEKIQQEDIEICEEVQRGISSRVFRNGPYSLKRETGQHHFHRLLAQNLEGLVL